MKADNLITREVLEYFSNRSSHLALYPESSPGYVHLWSELYDEAEKYEPLASGEHVVEENGQRGLYHDVFQHYLIPPIFDDIQSTFLEDVCIGGRQGKFGLVKKDGTGELVCPCIYDDIVAFDHFADLFCIEVDESYGVLYYNDITGMTILQDPVCDAIESTSSGFLLLQKDGLYGLCRYGYRLPIAYERIHIPSILGWVKVMKDGVWGYIDSNRQFTEKMSEAFLHVSSF